MKFGKAFSDNVQYERDRRGIFATSGPTWWFGTGRPLLCVSLLFLAFFILFWRLFTLTIINGHRYRLQADTNRTKQLTVHAPRGMLLDRTGKPLAFNTPYVRVIKPCDDRPETLCTSKVSVEEGERLKEKGKLASWFLESDFKREYALPEALFHVMGYVGEVNEAELADDYYQLRGYTLGDEIGRSGVEAVFEEQLRGKDGKEFVEVDARGTTVRVLGQTASVEGNSISLSFDKGLAEAVYNAFPKDEKGAVVVSKPTTGEILALFSSPTFSSEFLTRGLESAQYDALMANPDLPFLNRSIGGVYPPGSIFKLITATAGLEEHVIKKSTLIEDIGEIAIGQYKFPTWNFKKTGKTDGMVDVVKALQKSNDIYFYKVGELLGITKFGVWARKMGVGTLLGIELPGEAKGLMPDPEWKNNAFQTSADLEARSNQWYLGDTYHAAIGQGYVLTTPLQGNFWTNIIANGGKLCKPTVRKIDGGKPKNDQCKDLGIQKDTIDAVIKGMIVACEPGGTGYPLFHFGIRKTTLEDGTVVSTTSGTLTKIPVACKTGTAEFGDPKQKTHAWFTVFAPLPADALVKAGLSEAALAKSSVQGESILSGEPEISVTVLIEGAGEGSDKAAPVAKKILEEWFNR